MKTSGSAVWSISVIACLCLFGCEGPAGRAGTPGEPGQPGGAGEACTVVNNGDGTYTLTCGDEVVTVSDGTDGESGQNGQNGENGQKGDDGEDGPPGPSAADVFDVRAEVPERLLVHVDAVGMGAPPVVEFRVTDGIGRGAVGLAAGPAGQLRFALARLVPAAAGEPSRWVSYVNRLSGTVAQATAERTGTLVDHRDGRYTYGFLFDPLSVTDPATGAPIGYDPGQTHRVAVQLSGSIDDVPLPAVNATHDFVPGGGALGGREIAATASCNECHDELRAHGSRYELKYCAVCHNPGTRDAGTGSVVDMTTMVHKIHMGPSLPSGTGYVIGGHSYGEVTYPQRQTNCRKCHDGSDAATPQGDNWRTAPSAEACGSCHDLADFANNLNHSPAAGSQPDNTRCAVCHSPDDIELVHAEADGNPYNPPVLPSSLSAIRYELLDAALDGTNRPVIEFRITRDGAALDLSGTTLPPDLTGGPSFLLAYALGEHGGDGPIDYDNLGRASAQPVSVALRFLRDGTQGTMVPSPTNAGAYVATLAWQFPNGSTLRAVALQGYFTQIFDGSGYARHSASATRPFAGDPVRRLVADGQKCTTCHEILEGHGGNRNIVPGDPASGSGEQVICTLCHVPNLSTSGRSHTADNLTMIEEFCGAAGCDWMDPLTFPEDSNNLRDMIHGIHASAVRTTPYRFVRSRGSSGIFGYDWSEVTFPAGADNCDLCHLPGTYYPQEGAAPTTVRTSDGTDETPTAVAAARNVLPNATDLVISPAASSCYYCHDSAAAVGHMEQNGGTVRWTRQDYLESGRVESCNVCHGPGRMFDVKTLHGLE